MNITVYCGADEGNNPEFVKRAVELGRWIAEHGHRLVFGAGNAGMMGAVSQGVIDGGGETVGVSPKFFVDAGVTREDLTERIVARNLPERRQKMIELGDAFIALPGGTGTLDEISEVIALKRLDRLSEKDKPVMIYNVNGYYDNLFRFFDDIADSEFYRAVDRQKIIEVKYIDDIARALENAVRGK